MSVKYLGGIALKRLLCISCLIVALDFSSHAQQVYQNDTAALQRLFDSGLGITNPDSALIHFHHTLQLALENNNNFVAENSYLKLGDNYMLKGDWPQAISYIQHALPYCGSYKERCNYYCYLGWIYYVAGEYVTASESFYSALEELKQHPNSIANESTIYRYLGMINFKLQQNKRALYYYKMSESAARRFDHQRNYMAKVLISEGDFFVGLHKADSAQKCYRAAIVIADKIFRTDLKAEAIEGLGNMFIECGKYTKAVSYLQSAIDISGDRDKELTNDAALSLGEALYRLKHYNEAEATLTSALKAAKENNLRANAILGYTKLVAVYKANGQHVKALESMDSLMVLKDALLSTEKVNAINRMDVKYQSVEKDKKIAQQENILVRKNIWIVGITAGILIVLIVSGWVYLHAVNKQRTLGKENEIRILNAAILGGDNERGRIARELHDGLGGMLSAAMMRFSAMQRHNAAATETPAYKDAMNILREMGFEIRKTAHNLMPEVLLKQSLPEAVGAYCSSIGTTEALKIEFQYYGGFDDVTEMYKLNLYRMVQELVKNIIHHAGASTAIVQLIRTGDSVILNVEDNGIGFDEENIQEGQGLHNTRTRVKTLSGKFTVESICGKGTSIFIEIAIPKKLVDTPVVAATQHNHRSKRIL